MRKTSLIILSLVMMASLTFAQSEGIGIGLNTEGLTGKYWLSHSNAIGVDWNFGTHLSADYLFEDAEMLELTEAITPISYGVGIGIGTHEGLNDELEEITELDVNLRGVIGIGYYFSSFPADIYIESVPTIGIVGGGGLHFGGTLGIRYFF